MLLVYLIVLFLRTVGGGTGTWLLIRSARRPTVLSA